jgi:hypothetical protein
VECLVREDRRGPEVIRLVSHSIGLMGREAWDERRMQS